MRRSLILLLALLAVLPVSVQAAPGPERVQRQSYLVPHGVWTSHYPDDYTAPAREAAPPLEFVPRAGDRSVRFTIDDASGRMVILLIRQEVPGAEPFEFIFCDIKEDVNLASERPIQVKVLHGLCENHNWSFASSGTVTATFSARRVKTAEDHLHQ